MHPQNAVALRPLSTPRRGRIRTALAALVGAGCILLLGSLAIDFTSSPYEPEVPAEPTLAEAYPERLPEGPFMEPFVDPLRRNVLLIGDGRVQDFVRLIQVVGAFGNSELSAIHIPDACQPYFGDDDITAEVPEQMLRLCHVVWENVLGSQMMKDANTVIYAAEWQPWFAGHFDEMINLTIRNSTAEILVLGVLPAPDAPDAGLEPAIVEEIGSDIVLELGAHVCPKSVDCVERTPEGSPLRDADGRLTTEGAEWLGPILFMDKRLAPYLFDGA